jgi:hypothetical protein
MSPDAGGNGGLVRWWSTNTVGPADQLDIGTSPGWHLDRLERINGVAMSGTINDLSTLAIRW